MRPCTCSAPTPPCKMLQRTLWQKVVVSRRLGSLMATSRQRGGGQDPDPDPRPNPALTPPEASCAPRRAARRGGADPDPDPDPRSKSADPLVGPYSFAPRLATRRGPPSSPPPSPPHLPGSLSRMLSADDDVQAGPAGEVSAVRPASSRATRSLSSMPPRHRSASPDPYWGPPHGGSKNTTSCLSARHSCT